MSSIVRVSTAISARCSPASDTEEEEYFCDAGLIILHSSSQHQACSTRREAHLQLQQYGKQEATTRRDLLSGKLERKINQSYLLGFPFKSDERKSPAKETRNSGNHSVINVTGTICNLIVEWLLVTDF